MTLQWRPELSDSIAVLFHALYLADSY